MIAHMNACMSACITARMKHMHECIHEKTCVAHMPCNINACMHACMHEGMRDCMHERMCESMDELTLIRARFECFMCAMQSVALVSGSLKENYVVVGLAVKHLGMRPSQAVIDQAVFSFLAMCVPRSQLVCRHLDQLSVAHVLMTVGPLLRACMHVQS